MKKYVKTKKVSEMNELEYIIYKNRKNIVKIFRSNLSNKSIGRTRVVCINPEYETETHRSFTNGILDFNSSLFGRPGQTLIGE